MWHEQDRVLLCCRAPGGGEGLITAALSFVFNSGRGLAVYAQRYCTKRLVSGLWMLAGGLVARGNLLPGPRLANWTEEIGL